MFSERLLTSSSVSFPLSAFHQLQVLLVEFAQPNVCENSLHDVKLLNGLKFKKRREAW
jgi:hypothetical protein